MVHLYTDHPARFTPKTRRALARLSFGKHSGMLYDYIIPDWSDTWNLNDKIFVLFRNDKPFAWLVRAQTYPYDCPSIMIYVKKTERRKGWGTYLYKLATGRSKFRYDVYGSHSRAADSFYTKLGREDYN